MRSPAAPHRASSVSAGPEVFLPSRRSGAGVRWSGGRRRAAPQPESTPLANPPHPGLIPGKPVRPAVCRMPPSRLASRSQRWLLVLMAGHTILARSCPHLGTTVEDRTTSQPEIRQNPRSEVPSEELHPNQMHRASHLTDASRQHPQRRWPTSAVDRSPGDAGRRGYSALLVVYALDARRVGQDHRRRVPAGTAEAACRGTVMPERQRFTPTSFARANMKI